MRCRPSRVKLQALSTQPTVSSPDEDTKAQSRHDAGSAAQPRIMARPDPRVVQASRHMAHPLRFGRLHKALATATSRLSGSLQAGASRLLPAKQRHRDISFVVVFLLVASGVAASVPGGWAGAMSSGPSSRVAVGAGSASDAAESIEALKPVPTSNVPMLLPAARLTPTLPPTPEPTPAPTKAPHVYSFVALGDSLTSGYGASGPSWPSRLGSVDSNLRLANNAGIPGNVTSEMLGRETRDVFSYQPEVMFLLGGTNDVGRSISQTTTIANLRAIIVAAQAKGIQVFMMTIPPNSYAGMAANINSLNAAIIHLANSYRIVCIDIHAVLSTSTGVYISKYTVDGVHFSDLGAQVVATTVYSRIHRLGY
jgi:acyl-CoA thioesterase-1